MKLSQKVQNIIEYHELLHRGDGVIVGCSGGPDSMCLLHLLMELREALDLTLCVVHLEHGFRGQESEQDARYVEEFCKQNGIHCVVHREQVRELARKAGISEETAGREARYRRFFEEKKKLERQLKEASAEKYEGTGERLPQVKIAVAHNKNDQAETILMRIMRGTGLEGLKGMELSREDGIIRPLLTTERKEIEAYCEEHALEPRRDHTNEEADYTRNRIRLELIPYMREHFNDNVEEALCRLGQIASENQDVISMEVERARSRADDRTALKKMSDGLRHGVMMAVLKDLGLTTNLSSVHLYEIDHLLVSGSASGEVELPKGYRVAVSYDRVLWKPPADAGDLATEATEPCGGIRVWEVDRAGDGWMDGIRQLPDHQKCFDGDKLCLALNCTELDQIRGGLSVRFRKPGDFIRPLGSPGRKKLQDWFVDQKIPRQVRDQVPLVCIGSEVLWIVGYRISENYKVEEQTKRLIFVEFHQ